MARNVNLMQHKLCAFSQQIKFTLTNNIDWLNMTFSEFTVWWTCDEQKLKKIAYYPYIYYVKEYISKCKNQKWDKHFKNSSNDFIFRLFESDSFFSSFTIHADEEKSFYNNESKICITSLNE